ncbi:MAG: S-formylglutathione hydrolase [Burkholderiaceae bacterium]
MPMTLERIAANRCFGGTQFVYSHASRETGSAMRFGAYLPPQAEQGPVPVLYWLSGLTCTEENFIVKAGAQRVAAELGLAIIAPDTSPRGLGLPGEDDSYDFGTGAGFYLDATLEPWARAYRMYSYVSRELPDLVEATLPVDGSRSAIFGHSMGGHGALTIALKNPGRFRSVSAFSPIVAPSRVPWGQKALAGYLGDDRAHWREYDSCELVRSRGWAGPALLIEQGDADPFLNEHLRPGLLADACADAAVPPRLNMREGYDHSYFFIATFIGDHLRYHAGNLDA